MQPIKRIYYAWKMTWDVHRAVATPWVYGFMFNVFIGISFIVPLLKLFWWFYKVRPHLVQKQKFSSSDFIITPELVREVSYYKDGSYLYSITPYLYILPVIYQDELLNRICTQNSFRKWTREVYHSDILYVLFEPHTPLTKIIENTLEKDIQETIIGL